jgi:hypothetical protein
MLPVSMHRRERCAEAQERFLQRCFYQAVSEAAGRGIGTLGTIAEHSVQRVVQSTLLHHVCGGSHCAARKAHVSAGYNLYMLPLVHMCAT